MAILKNIANYLQSAVTTLKEILTIFSQAFGHIKVIDHISAWPLRAEKEARLAGIEAEEDLEVGVEPSFRAF